MGMSFYSALIDSADNSNILCQLSYRSIFFASPTGVTLAAYDGHATAHKKQESQTKFKLEQWTPA